MYNALFIPAISHWIAGELDYWGGGGVCGGGGGSPGTDLGGCLESASASGELTP